MSLCVLNETCEIIIRSICRYCQGGETVILKAGNQGEVLDRVCLRVSGDVLDVQCGGCYGQSRSIRLCGRYGLMTNGVAVVVGYGCL